MNISAKFQFILYVASEELIFLYFFRKLSFGYHDNQSN